MPYLPQYRRDEVDPALQQLIEILLKTGTRDRAGLLNYTIAKICDAWFADDRRYDTANSIAGALSCANSEIYRRLFSPYEDIKVKTQGDCFSVQ